MKTIAATILALLLTATLSSTLFAGAVPPAGTKGGGEQLVTLKLEATPIRDAIDMLFNGSGKIYSMPTELRGTVTLNLIEVPFSNALDVVLKAAGLACRIQQNGTYAIEPVGQGMVPGVPVLAMDVPSIPPGGITATSRPGGPIRFDLAFKNVSAYDVIAKLMEMSAKNYVLDIGEPMAQSLAPQRPSVQSRPWIPVPRISASIKGVTLEQAIDMVCKAAGLRIDRTAGGAFIFRRQVQQTLGPALQGPPPPPAAQFKCPRCKAPIQPNWKYCTACGAQIRTSQ